MKRKTFGAAALAVALTFSMTGSSALASGHMLDEFTQAELDTNWEADRQFPSGGVLSESDFGRDNVAELSIDSGAPDQNTFRRTEGLKTPAGNFGQAVQIDLYIDPDWADTATRAGFWVVGDDGAGARDNIFGIIEFVNLELSTSGDSAQGDHEGWRMWDSNVGWVNLTTAFTYGEWVTLSIMLDTTLGQYTYAVDGENVGTVVGGNHFIRELFINSYNYGLDTFPTLDTASYAAHWHVGLEDIDSKDQCKDGSWEAAGFKNQGQCIKFVNTGQDSR